MPETEKLAQKKNELYFNLSKCHCTTYRRLKDPIYLNCVTNDEYMLRIYESKDLGVNFSANLGFWIPINTVKNDTLMFY